MFGFFNTRRSRKSRGGVHFAGRSLDYGTLCQSILLLGGVGMGKTSAMEQLIADLMLEGCPMILPLAKEDDCQRIIDIAKKVGHLSRVVEVTPYTHQMNLMDALLAPNGSAANASSLLLPIGEIAAKSSGASHGDKFWDVQGRRAMEAAITLCQEVRKKVTLIDVYQVISTTPESLEEVDKNPNWDDKSDKGLDGKPLNRGLCAQLVVEGQRMGLMNTSPAFRTAVAYLTREMPGGGDRMRGGVLANAANSMGFALYPPFDKALSSGTTLNPAMIDEHNLICPLNYPTLVHFTPAQQWMFAWTMETQRHCLRRGYKKGTPPFVMVRDECAWILSQSWDSRMSVVTRSSGLATIDAVQDVNTLLNCLGGSESEAFSFLSNHMGAKVCFGTHDSKTATWISKLIGDVERVKPSGGNSSKGGFMEEALGANVGLGWNVQWEPLIRPEELARLQVGEAVCHAQGEGYFHKFKRFS